MSEARRLTAEQVEERRTNLRAFRKELEMEGDQTFNTTLQMQEEWLATVDALLARERELVAALEALVKATQPMDFCHVCQSVHSNFKDASNHKEWCAWAKADAARALAQGKKA